MIKTPLSTMIGGAFWTPGATILGSTSATLDTIIKSLFANSEQGFAYDPNDLTTLYQDTAGTVPVTAVGQPVGLMLDKSKGLKTVTLPSANLNTNGWATTANSTWVKDANGVVSSSGGDGAFIKYSILEVGALYKATVTINSVVSGTVFLPYDGAGANGKLATTVGTITRYFVAVNLHFIAAYSNNFVGSISNLTLEKIQGNHAYQTVSASRPILQRNATTGAYYLAFDGADDFLQTNNIDFTATDKISLFAGVRKLSDAASAIVAELSPSSATNNGSFHLAAPDSVSGNNYQFASRGTVRSIPATPPTYISPISNVVSVAGEIASNTAKIRVDGAQVAQSTATQGTGNYGNYPLYIGRRGGASLPLNGHIYSLIGIGRLTTDAETIALEKLIAKNTGVTLSV